MFNNRRSYWKILGVATVTAVLVRLVVVEDFRVTTPSMQPGLLVGDLVILSKLDFGIRLPFSSYQIIPFRDPKRFEVVALTLPDQPGKTFVKRIIGFEGEKIGVTANKLTINGSETAEPFSVDWGEVPTTVETVEVPPRHIYVLGDNRKESTDSRAWGPLHSSCIKGRVRLVWLSIEPGGGIRKDRIFRRVE